MTVPGTIYGVILNDASEREELAASFVEKPYAAPPVAPVVYIKPRHSVTRGPVPVPAGGGGVVAAPTLALLFARDAFRLPPEQALAAVGAACLALDISLPQANYYRPAIVQKCPDSFLALGQFADPVLPEAISMRIDGHAAYRWPLNRLVRPAATLIADLSAFMTLKAGDLLMIGLPGDAPLVRPGQPVTVEADGFPALSAAIEEERP